MGEYIFLALVGIVNVWLLAWCISLRAQVVNLQKALRAEGVQNDLKYEHLATAARDISKEVLHMDDILYDCKQEVVQSAKDRREIELRLQKAESSIVWLIKGYSGAI